MDKKIISLKGNASQMSEAEFIVKEISLLFAKIFVS